MAGQRQASLIDLQYEPGFYSDSAPRDAKNRFKNGNWIRWNQGFAEKMGGTERIPLVDQLTSATTYVGAARAVIDWADLGGKYWTAIGTNKKLYVITGGLLYDITPLRKSSTVASPFTTTNGSDQVLVTDPDHRASTGDYIRIYDAAAVGGITLSGSYVIDDVTGPNTYLITAAAIAGSGATGGGTPTIEYDINGGLESNGELLGYGTGPYGDGTYGTPRAVGTGVQAKLRTWSLDNWGEDLMASYNNGPIFWWDRTSGPNSRAKLIDTGPPACQRILVNPENGFLIALGASNVLGDPDPMRVAWCEQGDFNTWLTIQNVTDQSGVVTAGGKRLDNGSRLITGIKTRVQNLIWTDTQLYAMQFLNGAEEVFGFTPLGACSIVSPNAAVDANGVAFFMCFDNFYIYDGTLRELPCDVLNHVYEDFDRSQAEKVFTSSNRAKTEVRWDYPSLSGNGENDRYVIYNWVDKCWYFGTQSRTAMHDVSEAMTGYRTNPYGLIDGKLYKHEVGTDFVDLVDDIIEAPPWFLETYDGSIGGSDQFYLINRIVPSFQHLSGIVRANFNHKEWPRQPSYNVTGPYNIEEDTVQLGVRIRSSQISMRLESTGAEGESFRLGVFQVLATPYTRRGDENMTTLDPFAVELFGVTNGIDTNTLTWTESTGGTFGIAGYRLYNADDDTLLFDSASPNIREFEDVDLVAGTYNYYVVAYDRKGNTSDHSNIVSLEIQSSAPVGPVTYFNTGTDLLTSGPSSSMTMSMTNSDIVPTEEGIANAVVVLTLAASTTSTAPVAISIGGVGASFIVQQASPTGPNDRTLVVAMARIPDDGFITSDITITWPSIGTPTVRATSDVYYNVNVTSDEFALGSTAVRRYGTDGEYGAGDVPYFNLTSGSLSSFTGFAATGYPTGQFGFLEGDITSGFDDYKGYAVGAIYYDSESDEFVLGLNGAPSNLTFAFVVDPDQSGNYVTFISGEAAVSSSGSWRIWSWAGPGFTLTDGFTTEVFGATITPLTVQDGGALVVGVMGGTSDGGPVIMSATDYFDYQETTRINTNGPRYRSAWRLVSEASVDERVVNLGNAVYPTDAIIAFLLAGTA